MYRLMIVMLLGCGLFGADRADLRRMIKHRKIGATRNAGTAVRASFGLDRLRQSLVTDQDVVLPFIVNADYLRTRIRLVNLESRAVDLELFFLDDDGADAAIDLKDRGNVDFVSLKINALGTVTLDTSAQGEETIRWAFFDAGRNRIAATVSIELEEETGYYGASYSALHILDQVITVPFDNTEGHDTELSIINLSTAAADVRVVTRDAEGRQIDAQTVKFAPLNANAFAPADAARAARGARGTVECSVPTTSKGGVAAMAVQFFESGGFNLLPGYTAQP